MNVLVLSTNPNDVENKNILKYPYHNDIQIWNPHYRYLDGYQDMTQDQCYTKYDI